MPKKLNTSEFIIRATEIHGNKYDYSKTSYINKRTKIRIICKEHGEFSQWPQSHLSGCGCPECGKLISIEKKSHPYLSLEENIKRVKNKHGERYNLSLIPQKYSLEEKYPVLCNKCGNTIYVSIRSLLSNIGGCKYCKFLKQSVERRGVIIPKLRKRRFGVNDSANVATDERSFQKWQSMIQRCCDEEYKAKHPSYKNCVVCDSWLYYSEYRKWYEENYIKGFDIDKDVFCYGFDVKIYSPSTCCFIPPEINYMLTSITKTNKKKHLGVYKSGKSFLAIYSKTYLGSFRTEKDAIAAYVCEKKKHYKDIIDKWKPQLNSNIYNKLIEIINDIK